MVLGLINAAGAVALLVFGIRFLRKGLDRLFAERLDTWIGRVASGPVRALVAGAMLGAIAPSSTGNALLVVSLVHAKRLCAAWGMAILLGSYVGMTLVIALISFDIAGIAPGLLLVGVLLFQGTRRSVPRGIGQVILGLGLMFLSVGILKAATSPLATAPDVVTLMGMASRHPWAVALASAALAVGLQSSKSTIAVGMGLAFSGVIDLPIAIAMVIGANVGVSVTALAAGWRETESRRMGVGLLCCRVALAAVGLAGLGMLTEMVARSPGGLSHQIALVHTGFNVVGALACLPLVQPIARWMERLIPDHDGGDELAPVYLDPSWSGDPAVSFAQTRREIARMAQVVVAMLRGWWMALEQGDEMLCRAVHEKDDVVDRLDAEVKVFLTRQMSEGLDEARAELRIRQLRFASDLETIADVIDRTLVEVAEKRIARGLRFSDEGWTELRGFYRRVLENLQLAAAAFESGDVEIARRLLVSKESIRDEELALRARHFDRLRHGPASALETTGLHLEILSQLKHISHIASGVAWGILEPVSGEERRLERSAEGEARRSEASGGGLGREGDVAPTM